MSLFQGSTDTYWFWLTLLVTLMMAAAIWYIVLIGREKNYDRSKVGVTDGDPLSELEQDKSPVPLFLKITFIGTAIWGFVYLVWTGLNGMTGS